MSTRPPARPPPELPHSLSDLRLPEGSFEDRSSSPRSSLQNSPRGGSFVVLNSGGGASSPDRRMRSLTYQERSRSSSNTSLPAHSSSMLSPESPRIQRLVQKNFVHVFRSGWVYKKKVKNKGPSHWKRRWMVLNTNRLTYSCSETGVPIGQIDLQDCCLGIEGCVPEDDCYCFVLHCSQRQDIYLLGFEDKEVMENWLKVIQAALVWTKFLPEETKRVSREAFHPSPVPPSPRKSAISSAGSMLMRRKKKNKY